MIERYSSNVTKGDGLVKIWDLPLRVFHWSFMACVFGSIISGKMANWTVHERFGLAIMGLVLFRVIWGFIGSPTARFANFLTGPKKVFFYARALMRRNQTDGAGHSPLGGYATMALLVIPLLMALTGSISSDYIFYDGPFYHLVPEWANLAGRLHHLGEKLIFLIIFLHLAAIIFYLWRLRKNLIGPMITGRGAQADGVDGSLSRTRTIFGLVLMILLVGAAQISVFLRPDLY